ncbi:hypothetical protein HY489_05105 [Candidatus Woesearchaeota archaeon]|nr:hypothetical protein [Candidatus Woesearchaeota archaeon]
MIKKEEGVVLMVIMVVGFFALFSVWILHQNNPVVYAISPTPIQTISSFYSVPEFPVDLSGKDDCDLVGYENEIENYIKTMRRHAAYHEQQTQEIRQEAFATKAAINAGLENPTYSDAYGLLLCTSAPLAPMSSSSYYSSSFSDDQCATALENMQKAYQYYLDAKQDSKDQLAELKELLEDVSDGLDYPENCYEDMLDAYYTGVHSAATDAEKAYEDMQKYIEEAIEECEDLCEEETSSYGIPIDRSPFIQPRPGVLRPIVRQPTRPQLPRQGPRQGPIRQRK